MKTIKFLIMFMMISITVISCVDDDNDELTGNATTGGLVSANNALITYVVGSGNTYRASGSVTQGKVATTAINVYKTFNNAVTGDVSNRTLLTTVPISNTAAGNVVDWEVTFDYNSLKDGLTVAGAPLPDSDGGLNIGDFWSLEYEATTSAGDSNNNYNTTKVAVGTRYAGVYNVVESYYYNGAFGGLQGGSWNGSEVVIESVNATVYRHKGLAYWDDNEFFFTVDNETNYITIIEANDLLLNGSPAMTCEGAGGPFEWIPCDSSTSTAIPDDVNGEDQLLFTVGYFRGAGATREFFERLVKQVD